MQFKASTDYGLRAVLYLAAQGHTCSSKDIAQDMSIPRDYLIQLAQLLRNAGIIEARPGKHGGYRLANDPSKITLLQVVNALVKLLYLDKAEQVGVIDLGKWFPAIFGKVFDLKVLSEGDVLYVNLFGLKVSVALSKAEV